MKPGVTCERKNDLFSEKYSSPHKWFANEKIKGHLIWIVGTCQIGFSRTFICSQIQKKVLAGKRCELNKGLMKREMFIWLTLHDRTSGTETFNYRNVGHKVHWNKERLHNKMKELLSSKKQFKFSSCPRNFIFHIESFALVELAKNDKSYENVRFNI